MTGKRDRGVSSVSETKRAWEPLKLVYVGHVGEVLANGGQGKSPTPSDVDGLRGLGAG